MPERYAVGDAVSYHDGLVGTRLACRVIRVMPSEGCSGLYHIRDLAENFERAVPGITLTRILPSQEDKAFNLNRSTP